MTALSITEQMRGRRITPQEAAKSAQRLVNSHFRNRDSARVSIPARPDDDDLIVIDFILQTERDEVKTESRQSQELSSSPSVAVTTADQHRSLGIFEANGWLVQQCACGWQYQSEQHTREELQEFYRAHRDNAPQPEPVLPEFNELAEVIEKNRALVENCRTLERLVDLACDLGESYKAKYEDAKRTISELRTKK